MRESLCDGGLADARLSDQSRVVLRPPAQDLDDPLDLGLAADHRVKLIASGQLSEVASELVQQWRLRRFLRRGLSLGLCTRVVQQPLDLCAHLLQIRAEVLEHVGSNALAFDQQPKQQVLGADVVVTHAPRLFEGDLDDLLDPRRRDDLLDDDPLVAAEHRLDRLANLSYLDSKVVENLGSQTLTLTE